MTSRWYLVQTLASREFVADANLLRQGFTTFLPRTIRTVRHARKVRTAPCAYFPGYLFVSLDLEWDRWRAINGTLGAIGIVTSAGRPLPAPDGLVESLQSALAQNPFPEPQPVLKPGDPVRVLQGPFADHIGRIHQLSGADRVKVLLALMNGSVSVELERRLLSVA